MVKFLQANLKRSRAAHDMAYAAVKKYDIDILVASEPNRKAVLGNSGWIRDLQCDVAVHIYNKAIKIKTVTPSYGYVTLEMENGARVICGYISPNIPFQDYQDKIDEIMEPIGVTAGQWLIMGDLNGKAVEWGAPKTDERGRVLCEWIATLNLVIHNDGLKPTCITANGQSYIDLTLTTQGIARSVRDWQVTDDLSLSDHQHIQFQAFEGVRKSNGQQLRQVLNFDYIRFRREVKVALENLHNRGNVDPEMLTSTVKNLQDRCTARNERGISKVPYWWNPQISERRGECIAHRRTWNRTRPRTGVDEAVKREALSRYTESKKLLNREIRKAKRAAWRELCNKLEEDVWGQGYKIATRHLRGLCPAYDIPDDKKLEIIRALFPNGLAHEMENVRVNDPPLFTLDEITKAAQNLKSGTAPGLDGILPQSIKECVAEAPGIIIECLNGLLLNQSFPDSWKLAKVVLIPKGEDPNVEPKKYRPICLLHVLAKLYESAIRDRLCAKLEEVGGLSPFQYGFRAGRSTLMAIQRVCRCAQRTNGTWAIVVFLDVKNAFNTACWRTILSKLQDREMPRYLVNIVANYLHGRGIVSGRTTLDVTAGVPQGSVLGPTLWNVLYDDVLRIPFPTGVEPTAYADDLAITVVAKDITTLNNKTCDVLSRISEWMQEHRLRLAPEKTVAVVLKGPRKRDGIDIRMLGQQVRIMKEAKYLGVVIDSQGYFGRHVIATVEKAERRMAAIVRIMPNVGGPSSLRRRALWGVVQSTVLYAAPIWNKALRIDRYRNLLISLQRKVLIRVGSAYRTISALAIQAITGIPPLDLMVDERSRVWGDANNPPQGSQEARRETLEKWQDRWDTNVQVAQWTKRLIPELLPWISCKHRKTDYWLTQFLSGHGSYRVYTKKIGRDPVDTCRYCGMVDSTEHTIFVCERWVGIRTRLWGQDAARLTPDNIIGYMMEAGSNWTRIGGGIRTIMQGKEGEELVFQSGNHPNLDVG